jgi:hypothetical protein
MRFIVHHFFTKQAGRVSHEAGEASSIGELGELVCPRDASVLMKAAANLAEADTVSYLFEDYFFVDRRGRRRCTFVETKVVIHRID